MKKITMFHAGVTPLQHKKNVRFVKNISLRLSAIRISHEGGTAKENP